MTSLNVTFYDNNSDDRALFGFNSGFFFDNYACWCHFGAGLSTGSGKAQDDLDKTCKELHGAYQCIQHDQGDTCIPWEVEYVSFLGTSFHYAAAVTFFDDIGEIQDQCSLFNPIDDCKKYACMAEGYFVLKFVQAVQNLSYTSSNFVTNGFDKTKECKQGPGGGSGGSTGPVACCGTYPIKYPYYTNGGAKGCCGYQTYNTAIYTCCNEETVEVSC